MGEYFFEKHGKRGIAISFFLSKREDMCEVR